MLRRSFLKLTGWAAGVGVLAHHKPGHLHGPPAPATITSSTIVPALELPLVGGSDIYLDVYGAA